MTKLFLSLLSLLAFFSVTAQAQSSNPEVEAKAYYTDEDGDHEADNIEDGEAPLTVQFKAIPTDMGTWTPSYEWHFQKLTGDGRSEFLVRYEQETTYTFSESGSYTVTLKTYLRDGEFTAELDEKTIPVSISDSELEFPNAFSPNNGDQLNNVYKAKKHKSIVTFRAIILNRWGQKLYEWTDPDGGWDGTFHGRDVKQGVYFVMVNAKGADGKEYKIRKDVNLLRGFTEKGNSTTSTNE